MTRHATVILTISVVLNVLLAGMLLGNVSRNLVAGPAFDMEAQLMKLPPDKRTLFNALMRPAKLKMDGERARMDEAKAEALRILKADPFNQQAYSEQVRHINDLHMQMKREMGETIVTLANQYTRNKPEILADIISHPPFALPQGAMASGGTIAPGH